MVKEAETNIISHIFLVVKRKVCVRFYMIVAALKYVTKNINAIVRKVYIYTPYTERERGGRERERERERERHTHTHIYIYIGVGTTVGLFLYLSY